jgi:plasmid stabilization system protein ParE
MSHIVSSEAEAELEEIWYYIARERVGIRI